VLVLAGKDRGKQGEVIEVDHVKGRVLVAKVNMVKNTRKANRLKARRDSGQRGVFALWVK
jgi:ribosomal protein L24